MAKSKTKLAYEVNFTNFIRLMGYCKFSKIADLENNKTVNEILADNSLATAENITRIIEDIDKYQKGLKGKPKFFTINSKTNTFIFKQNVPLEKQSRIQPIRMSSSYDLKVYMNNEVLSVTISDEANNIIMKCLANAEKERVNFSPLAVVPVSDAVYILNSLFRRINILLSNSPEDKKIMEKINDEFRVSFHMRVNPTGIAGTFPKETEVNMNNVYTVV